MRQNVEMSWLEIFLRELLLSILDPLNGFTLSIPQANAPRGALSTSVLVE
jgi:hypothetical protein